MAVEPSLVVTAAGRSVVVAGDDDRIERVSDPFDAVQDLLDRYRLPSSSFYGPGFFGYLGYDLGRHVERIPSIAKDDSLIPDLWLGLYDHIIVFDHGGRTASLLSAEFGNAGRSRDRKAELLRTYRQALGNTTGFPEPAGETARTLPRSGESGNTSPPETFTRLISPAVSPPKGFSIRPFSTGRCAG